MTNRPSVLTSTPLSGPGAEQEPGILVVDDDMMLLALLKTVLQGAGFRVWAAPSGATAVELFRHNRANVDLVLLDVRMPVLDGPQTLAELRTVDPFVPCCFMSGYTGDYSLEDLEERGALRFFQKPFRAHEMAQELLQLARQQLRRSA